MKRTTIMLPEDLDLRLRVEANRKGVSIADVARDALEKSLPPAKEGPLRFFASGTGKPADVSERTEEFVAKAISRKNK